MSQDKQPGAQHANDDIQVDRTEVDGQYLTADELLSKLDLNVSPSEGQQHYKKRASRRPSRKHVETPAPTTVDSSPELLDKALDQNLATPTDAATINQSDSDSRALVRGSAWLSAGNIISRLLGAVFILPWLLMLGEYANKSNSLFSQGYNIYGIMLAIATFGFPSAIAKVVGKLIAQHKNDDIRSLTKQSLMVGVVLGVVFAAILYIGAPALSNQNDNVVPVLHSLAWAVLVFPLMSMLRGIFQGHQLMHISAISDIVEQIARIIYLLLATLVVLKLDPTNWVGAVVQATFAAFIGALFSMGILAWGWIKYKDQIMPPATPRGEPNKAMELVVHILKESWPFVIIGSATNLFLFVDQYSFFNIMRHFFDISKDDLQVQFALFSANPNKLVMIVISFATSIAASALPILAGARGKGDMEAVNKQLKQVLSLTMLVLLPAALGMFAISTPLYKMFYPIDSTTQEGIYLLQFSTMLTIVFSLFMLLAMILQSLSDTKIVLKSFTYGLLIKIVLQLPLVYTLQGMGALLASAIGMGYSVYYMLKYSEEHYQVGLTTVASDVGGAFFASAIMAIVVYLFLAVLNVLLPGSGKVANTVETILAVGVGGIVLLPLYSYFGLADKILGSYLQRLPKFLRPEHK
ncbi:putative polysaccharide biosynthesis protein [Eupransor demetentiae]|uniref:Membrane protein involved in the export of O-antigen and teichoic acid (RfbX) n=1 Tax=Eupransor demetentiae TaxID=3109584 RepID=A0ABM9N3J4_9LACO|nr:Membrane protein involved in the export of O-antigen and teichoic acid (RfbX) [Lactobacillaceae bacterium LMG 33000]